MYSRLDHFRRASTPLLYTSSTPFVVNTSKDGDRTTRYGIEFAEYFVLIVLHRFRSIEYEHNNSYKYIKLK